ncbi:MAG: hypothetical protein ABI232_12475 [Jatrophihabitantaceae bacterium]
MHCGIVCLQYQGENYRAVSPQDAPGRLPGTDGIVRETGYVHGFLQIIQRTAIFTVVDPTVTINGQQIQFRLLESATDPVPLCA